MARRFRAASLDEYRNAYVPKAALARPPIVIGGVVAYCWESVPCGHVGNDGDHCSRNQKLATACGGPKNTIRYNLIMYVGKAQNPTLVVWHTSEKSRDDTIIKAMKSYKARSKRVKERREERSNPPAVKVGDIFVSSWGYDQTNIDYYEVTRISPSGKSVDLTAIGKTVVETGRTDDRVAPDKSRRGEVYTNKRLGPTGYVRISSCQSASPWDGRARWQTGYGFGH